MQKKKAQKQFVSWISEVNRILSSVRLTVILLLLLISWSILGTLIPQGLSSQAYIDQFGWNGFRIIYSMGLGRVFSGYWLIGLLVMLGINVLACTFRRMAEKKSHFGFVLTHVSLILLILGGLFSAHGRLQGEIRLEEGQITSAFDARGQRVPLGFDLRLTKFEVEGYETSREKLVIGIAESGKSFDFPVIQGVWTEIPEIPYQFRVEQFIPDFRMDHESGSVFSASDEPNNPAIYVHVTGDGKDYGEWVFDKFADFHMKKETGLKLRYHWAPFIPKAFRSFVEILRQGRVVERKVIEVNRPLRFGGLLIFQADYDARNRKWTGLGVVGDPGVRWVYLGIFGLVAGLGWNIYLRPLLAPEKKK
jgi:cytochrome c biogenesis protein ResB